MPAVAAETDQWITSKTACDILSVGYWALKPLVKAGRLTCRRVPGCRPKFLRADAERLAEASTTYRGTAAK